MPTYNRVDMLPLAVESFLNQDYLNSNLYILNNGSTDGTAEYLKQFDNHERIKIITSSHNLTPPENFNVLLHHYADGDLVCHLHDDDKMLKDGISSRVKAFQNDPSLQVVYAGWITNGQIYYADPPFLERIIKEEYVNYLTIMWKRKDVDGTLDTELRYYHDWLFKIKCFKEYKVGHVMQPVIDYAIHLGQLSIECRKLGMNGIEEQLMRKKLKEQYGI